MNQQMLFFDNPVLVKHVRSRLRRQHLLPLIAAVIIVASCILWGAAATDCFKNGLAFAAILTLQSLILFLAGTAQVAAAVSQARESGMLDFHRISPQPPIGTALGFVIGAPAREWILFACTLPFSICCVLGGNPGPIGFARVLMVTLLSALLYHCVAALVGLLVPKAANASGTAVGAVMALNSLLGFGLVGAFTVIPTCIEAMDLRSQTAAGPAFYDAHLTPFALALIHQVPLLVFFAIPVVRKMRHERATLFPKTIAVAFHAVIGILIIGDLWDRSDLLPHLPVLGAVYGLVAAGLLLSVAVTPQAGDFANGVRRAFKQQRRSAPIWGDLSANWAPLLLLAALTFLGAVLAGFAPNQGSFPSAAVIAPAMIGACVVFYFGSAVQYFGLRFRKYGLYYFALFLFLSWLVPLLVGCLLKLSGAGDETSLAVASISPVIGIALAGHWGGFSVRHPEFATEIIICLAVALALVVIFVVLRIGAEKAATEQAAQMRPGTGEDRPTQLRRTRLGMWLPGPPKNAAAG